MVGFEVNNGILPRAICAGKEGTPVIMVDNFLVNMDDLQQRAQYEVASFQEDGKTAYPGVRTALPGEYVTSVLAAVEPILRQTYEIPSSLSMRPELAYYSLLTKRGSELKVLQRLPHFDTSDQHYYAVLQYINIGNFGGTGFFRHRPTGFERITNERRNLFMQSASAFMAVHGLPEQKYINGSTNHFELYAHVDYKVNRLVMYPGCMLHSGLVSEEIDVSADPASGRLTANIFLSFN